MSYVICKMFVSVDLKLSTLLASVFCFYFVLNSCFVLHLCCWIWQSSKVGRAWFSDCFGRLSPNLCCFVLNSVDWNVLYCCVLTAQTWLDWLDLTCYQLHVNACLAIVVKSTHDRSYSNKSLCGACNSAHQILHYITNVYINIVLPSGHVLPRLEAICML